jgi:Tfp pilus assembly protein PilE
MSVLAKILVAASVCAVAFAAGYQVASTSWEKKFSEFQLAAAQATIAKQKAFEDERTALEETAAQLRSDLASKRTESDKLRTDIAVWRSRAKTAESRFALECVGVAAECADRVREAESIIRYCQKALPGRDERSAKRNPAE